MKTGPEDQYIGFYGLPTLRFDAVLSHLFYRVCNDVDVVPFKRVKPGAIVDQQAFSRRGIVRYHLGKQFRIFTDNTLAFACSNCLMMSFSPRRPSNHPGRVTFRSFHHALRCVPEYKKAIPVSVIGQIFEQPVFTLRNVRLIFRPRKDPGRGTLKDIDLRCIGSNVGYKLERTGAGSYNSNLLPRQIVIVFPACRVENRAAKVDRPVISGILGLLSWPTAAITAFTTRTSHPSGVSMVTSHRAVSSLNRARFTSVLKRMLSMIPLSSATCLK